MPRCAAAWSPPSRADRVRRPGSSAEVVALAAMSALEARGGGAVAGSSGRVGSGGEVAGGAGCGGVGAAGGGGPGAGAVGGHGDGPAGVVLEAVVGRTEALQVGLDGLSVGEGGDVVELAAAGRDAAAGEAAVPVAGA